MLTSIKKWSLEKYRWCSSQPWLVVSILFFIYQVLLWATHILMVSFSSYIHFLLDHRLGTIEEWIFYHGWEIAISSKLIITYLALKFILVISSERNPFVSVLKRGKPPLGYRFYLSLVPLVVIFCYLGKPVSQTTSQLSRFAFFISFIGNYLLFACEACVLHLLVQYRQLRKLDSILICLIVPSVSFFVQKATFLYAIDWGIVTFALTFLVGYLVVGSKVDWGAASAFSFFIIAPISSIFGLDPIWSKNFSPFVFAQPLNIEVVFITVILSVYYWERMRIGPILKPAS